MKTIFNVLKGRTLIVLLAGIVLGIAGIKFHFCLPFAFVCIFTVFDYIGYCNIMHSNQYSIDIPAYRIIENMFMYVILLLVLSMAGWLIALCAVILWITGNEDLLYYYVGNDKLDKEWTWLSWTPFGLIYYIKSKPMPLAVVLIQAFLGLLTVIIILTGIIK